MGLNFSNKIADLSSSHNFTQFQKTNRPNRSSRSEDIVDLKSSIFWVFRDDETEEFITFHRVLRLLPDQCHWINYLRDFFWYILCGVSNGYFLSNPRRNSTDD
jgi:hypothetical protein